MAVDPQKTQHQAALDQFKLVVETERKQRERELEDLKFHAGEQWPADVVAQRAGHAGGQGQSAVPARPMLTIRSLDQPIAQVINQARSARMAIKISPKAGGASQETADVLQGLCRAIEYDSHAQTAYLWAYQRAVIAGRGYFRIDKAYALDDPDDGEPDPGAFDQELQIVPILNGATVYLDPWAQALNDPAAAQWAFVTEDIPKARYEREFGKTKLANAESASELLTGLGDQRDQWVLTDESGGQSYRIAERFWVEYDKTTQTDPTDPSRKREIQTRRVMWAKLNGIEFIEAPQEWDGTLIPIIPVLGNEMNIGGKRLWEGMVRPSMDPCRMLNYMVTSMAEQVGLATRAPWIGYKGQFEGLEDQWQLANLRNQPYLEVNPKLDDVNEVLPRPERNVAEPPIQALTQAQSLFVNFIRATTGVPDAALGHTNSNDRSGKAIAQLQQASEQGTSNFPDNLQRGIQHAGVVLLDLIPKIYDRPGRIVQILTGQDDEQSSVMLNQPFTRQQGEPQALQPGEPPPMQQGPAGPMPAPVEHYDLAKGRYSVVVETGKSYATRRQESSDALGALAQAVPEMVPKFADLWVKSLDIPESEALAERLKPPGTDDNLPPQIQQAMAQMQAENQQLKQLLQTEQIKQQAQLQIAQMNNDSRERIEAMSAQASLVATQAKIESSNAQALLKAEFDRLGELLKERTAIIKHTSEMSHDQAQHMLSQAHEVGMAAQAHAHATDLATHTAALAPEPTDNGNGA